MSVIVHLTGKVKKADYRFTPSGTQVLAWTFSKNVGTKDKPEWNNFKAVMFGNQAEALSQYVTEGTRFSITGKQKITSYQRQDGTTGIAAEIIVVDFEFAGDPVEKKKEESEEEPPF